MFRRSTGCCAMWEAAPWEHCDIRLTRFASVHKHFWHILGCSLWCTGQPAVSDIWKPQLFVSMLRRCRLPMPNTQISPNYSHRFRSYRPVSKMCLSYVTESVKPYKENRCSFWEPHKTHNTLYGQIIEFLNVKPCGTSSGHCGLNKALLGNTEAGMQLADQTDTMQNGKQYIIKHVCLSANNVTC